MSRTNHQLLNQVCLGICVLCIVLGLVISLGMIWFDGFRSDFSWKVLASNGVVFVAAAATLSVSRTFGGRQ